MNNLQSFQIKEDKLFFDDFSNVNFLSNEHLFEKIFNNGNQLERLTIPIFYLNNLNNLYLHSIRLNLIIFEKIFLLIKFPPNLEYLNIESFIPHTIEHQISINKMKRI